MNKQTYIFFCILGLFANIFPQCREKDNNGGGLKAQNVKTITFDCSQAKQTIHSFGASDCWRTQYIGKNWPLEKRERIAEVLFSTEFDKDGNPLGIGLSLWRFNIGSGSHEAGDKSGVASEWRRTECFLDADGNWDWSKQEGQRWFLDKARRYKVPYALGFSITAPYFMTKNGMARASERTPYANIQDDKYDDYAVFMATVSQKMELDYLSPINEPQWEWVGSHQEGMQATNEECARLVRELDIAFNNISGKTKVVFGETGDIRYLYRAKTNKPLRDNQIKDMFTSGGKNSIKGLKYLASVITGHSYWSTWPLDTLIIARMRLKESMRVNLSPSSEYWQTEYCPMENNADNLQGGGGRDLGMNTALYIARIIHHDLTVADAASWQSWTAFTEWDYKDGLIYIDDGIQATGARSGNDPLVESCKYDGVFRTSKYMWALGNYSLFVRPGMVRIAEANPKSMAGLLDEAKSIMYSAYMDEKTNQRVVVLVNYGKKDEKVDIVFNNTKKKSKNARYRYYETSENSNLEFKRIIEKECLIPARSVVTLVSQ